MCRVGSWWSSLPKGKQDLIIVIAGLSIMAAIAIIVGSFGKHGFEAWTWHLPA
jgi:hypothetical protein